MGDPSPRGAGDPDLGELNTYYYIRSLTSILNYYLLSVRIFNNTSCRKYVIAENKYIFKKKLKVKIIKSQAQIKIAVLKNI